METSDILNISLSVVNVSAVVYGAVIVYKYQHKEYEVSLYQKQLDQAEKLTLICSEFTSKLRDIYIKEYTEFLNKPKSGKADDISNNMELMFFYPLSLKMDRLIKECYDKIVYYSSLLPDEIVDKALNMLEEVVDFFEDTTDESIDLDLVLDFFGNKLGEVLSAIRENLHVTPLSESTLKKISSLSKYDQGKK